MDANENQIPGYSGAVVPVRSSLLVIAMQFTVQQLPFKEQFTQVLQRMGPELSLLGMHRYRHTHVSI